MSEETDPGVQFTEFVEERLDAEDLQRLAGQSAVVCTADAGNVVVYVSEVFEQHTGYSLTDAIGRNLAFLQGPETERHAVQEFRRLIQSGTSGTIRITNYRKDGTRFVHECEFRPVRDSDGRVTHFVTIQRPA